MSHHYNNGFQNFDPLILPQNNNYNNNNNVNLGHASGMSNGNFNNVFYCTESPLDDHSYYSNFPPLEVACERVVTSEQTIDHSHVPSNNNIHNNNNQNAKHVQHHHQPYIPFPVQQQQQQQQYQQQQPHPHPQHRYSSSTSSSSAAATSSSSTNRPNFIHIPSSNFDLDEDHLPAAVPLDYGAVMDSVCREQEALGGLRRARVDRTIFDDDRVFANLLRNEQRYMPSSHYFKTLQSDLKPFMRKMVTDWMLEVCEEQQCEDDVFALAVNYLDRFLSQVPVQKQHLQLVAAVAMFVASKLKESTPLTADKLVLYTDNSITYEQMLTWELLLLGRLRWDVAAITPHDFFDQILWRLRGVPKRLIAKIRRHAQQFASLTATDFKFIHYPPSMISACCISAAIAGLNDEAGLAAAQAAAVDAAFFAAASASSSSSSSRRPFHPLSTGVSSTMAWNQSSSLSSSSTSSSPLLPEFCFGLIDLESIFHQLQRITDIDAECLRQCHEQIEVLVCANSDGVDGAAAAAGNAANNGVATPTGELNKTHGGQRSEGALTTPTDVEAVAMMISAQ